MLECNGIKAIQLVKAIESRQFWSLMLEYNRIKAIQLVKAIESRQFWSSMLEYNGIKTIPFVIQFSSRRWHKKNPIYHYQLIFKSLFDFPLRLESRK